MIRIGKNKKMLGYDSFSVYSNISHFITTREGGVGVGNYGTFNCSPHCGDNPTHQTVNQKILLEELNITPKLVIHPYQTHQDKVAIIDSNFFSFSQKESRERLIGYDAVVTALPQTLLCIATADCVPILLLDPEKGVVAAVHAGWRGTVSKIVLKTLQVMQEEFGSRPKNILAGIGPSISLKAFEVGDEVVDQFGVVGFPLTRVVRKNEKTGKSHIDLWLANELLLEEFGLSKDHIERSELCTYTNNTTFFSARRLGIKSGRILSGIMLKE